MLKTLIITPLLVILTACGASLSQLPDTGLLTTGDTQLARGVKAALELGSTRAADLLAAPGGYSKSPSYRITLPQELEPITDTMRMFGMGKALDKTEALMNQAAEEAAAEAKDLFVGAVRNMTVTDALGIVRGSNTAATEYFRAQTESSLRQKYQPILQDHLRQLGFYDQYKSLLSLYQNLPVSNKPNLDLEDYAMNEGLDALFTQVAKEEMQIRADPVGQGSQLIGTVFGSNR